MLKNTMAKIPIVFIIGATGCGKSKLAVHVAKTFSGEIISADSMQVYKGLDITTNKTIGEEQKGVPHYLLDVCNPLDNYSVVDFRNQALSIVQEVFKKNKLPIVVGGTNYYIEALLWDFLVTPLKEVKNENLLLNSDRVQLQKPTIEALFDFPIIPSALDNIDNDDLHKLLTKIDRERAQSLHPNDRRKVIRSLQVFQQMGKLHSELLNEQHIRNGCQSVSGPLRFANSLILWVQCDTNVLEKRIDDRVDDMIRIGLINEMSNFHQEYNQQRLCNNSEADYTKGIFQSIGFKEFHNYLLLSEDERKSKHGEKLFEDGVESMKRVTRHYAKKQNRWIENRFLKKGSREIPPVYAIDSTCAEKWDENCENVAYQIVQAFLKGEKPEQKPLPIQDVVENRLESFHCSICNKIIVGTNIWEIHLKSKSHHKRKQKFNKTTASPENLEAQQSVL